MVEQQIIHGKFSEAEADIEMQYTLSLELRRLALFGPGNTFDLKEIIAVVFSMTNIA